MDSEIALDATEAFLCRWQDFIKDDPALFNDIEAIKQNLPGSIEELNEMYEEDDNGRT